MKKLLLTLVLFALVLTGCSTEQQTVYTVESWGESFTVDTEAQTISDGTYTYDYTVNGNSVTVYYPDGSSYWWTWSDSGSGHSGQGGWSDDYDHWGGTYASGDYLVDAVRETMPEKKENQVVFFVFGLIFIGLGIWNVAQPETSWYLSYGWRYKDAEPSDMALTAGRISGVVSVIIGISMLFFV